MNAVRWLGLILIVAAVLWIRIVPRVFHQSGLVPAPATAVATATDDATAVITRFGKPDRDIVTGGQAGTERIRTLTYRDLEIVLTERTTPTGPMWRLVGFLDSKTKEALSGDVALGRLLKR